jgi:hypothetical protein
LTLNAIGDRRLVVGDFGAGWNSWSKSSISSVAAFGERSDERTMSFPRRGVPDEKSVSSIGGNDRDQVRSTEQPCWGDTDFSGGRRRDLRRTDEAAPGSVGAGVADRSSLRREGEASRSDIGWRGCWLDVLDKSVFTSDGTQFFGFMGGQLRNRSTVGVSAA